MTSISIKKNIKEQWPADLVAMSNTSDINDNAKFMITSTDKYVWVCVLENKIGSEVTKAFGSVFGSCLQKQSPFQHEDETCRGQRYG